MKKRISTILCFCTLIASFVGITPVNAQTTVQAQYWVSTTRGNDDNNGSEASPFKTVEKARDTIRTLTKTGEIVVNIEPGDYYFDETLTFTAADSGAEGFIITYKSSGDAGAVNFIGGRPVTDWTPYKNGIYYTEIDSNELVYMIYEEGQRNSHAARYPNFVYDENYPTAKAPYLYAKGGKGVNANTEGQDYDVEILPTDSQTLKSILPKNNDMYDLRLVIWPGGRWDWSMEFHRLSCIHLEKNWINVASRMQYAANRDKNGVHGGARYYFTGHLNLLDQPGEFYMDTTNFRLYYKPYDVANLTNGNIIIPTVDTILSISAEASALAQNIVFEGIAFKKTNFIDTVGAYISTSISPAVKAKNIESVEFSKCVIRDVAGDGIDMSGVVKNCSITNCHFKNIGRNGINISGNDVWGIGSTKDDASAQGNIIYNCFLEYIGTTLGQGVGITLSNNYKSKISHCTLENGARKGITLRRNSSDANASTAVDLGENTIEYILIDGFGQDSGDTAGIHLHGIGRYPKKMTNNTFNQIYIKNMRANSSINDHQPSGFYTDYGSDCQIIRNVMVENFGYWPRIWYGGNNANAWPACQTHTLENVSWVTANGPVSAVEKQWGYTTAERALVNARKYFNESEMEIDKIGVLADSFPFADEL